MPLIGETVKDKYSHTLMWQPCERCGKERWVRCIRGIPRNKICSSCYPFGQLNPKNTRRGKDTWVADGGYIIMRNPLHPNAWKNGGIRRSHFILEQTLGRPLGKGMIVHHINGDVQDDRPENLLEMSRQEHARLHHQLRRLSKLGVD